MFCSFQGLFLKEIRMRSKTKLNKKETETVI
jgi:hypothetical protein